MRAGQLVQPRHEAYSVEALDALALLVPKGDGDAALEFDRQVGRFFGCETWIDRPGKGILGWLVPRIFERARLDAAAPQIGVHGVGAVGGDRHRDVVLLGE